MAEVEIKWGKDELNLAILKDAAGGIDTIPAGAAQDEAIAGRNFSAKADAVCGGSSVALPNDISAESG